MDKFEEKPLTVTERRILENQEYKRRRQFLYKVGYNSSGCYILTFPNGKKYIGKAMKLGRRLEQHFSILAPVKISSKRPHCKWYDIAMSENKGAIKSFQDINVQIYYTLQYEEKEKELLKNVPIEARHNYYNTQWNDL